MALLVKQTKVFLFIRLQTNEPLFLDVYAFLNRLAKTENTYFMRGGITVRLASCFICVYLCSCFAFVAVTTDLIIWLNSNPSNMRSAKH